MNTALHSFLHRRNAEMGNYSITMVMWEMVATLTTQQYALLDWFWGLAMCPPGFKPDSECSNHGLATLRLQIETCPKQ